MNKKRNLLKSYRIRSTLSQKDISFLMEQSHTSSISKIENGHQDPNIKTLLVYKFLFDEPIEQFFLQSIKTSKSDLIKRLNTLNKTITPRTELQKQKIEFINSVIIRLKQ